MNCRVWLPKQLCSLKNQKLDSILFGWFIPSSSSSIDVIIAPILISSHEISDQIDLQGIMHSTNGKMTESLQENSTFSVLGQCVSDRSNKPYHDVGFKQVDIRNVCSDVCQEDSVDINERELCGCHKLDKFLDDYRRSSIKNGIWIQLSYINLEGSHKGICWTSKLDHLHCGEHQVPSSDVHCEVIIYDPPTFGTHHFSLKSWSPSRQVRDRLKNPMWVDKLYQKKPLPDLEIVIITVNSATYAAKMFEGYRDPKSSIPKFSFVSMLGSVTCHLAGILLASLFTLIYIILQLFYRILCYGSQAPFYAIMENIFCHTWKNIYIRSCQILYWPIHLQDSGFRSQSNVEYAHRSTLHKHSMWSSVVVDLLLGNVVGFTLLYHLDAACPQVLNLIHDITNNWLRSGCVWLMGIPAGFKLNTELAGLLGMVSLNAIQIWSTLWVYLGFLFPYFVKGIALSSIISGLTIAAALLVDIFMLATSHISTLHWLISLLYSHQIKSLAALWRLFRGRKWNPLRQRFDSYDYTVKQHVVGSLVFTPLLLLLPTTSVFYIFFTILNTTVSFICILIELTISILHATPYHEIFLWVIRPRRFPSGLWFYLVSSPGSQQNRVDPKDSEAGPISFLFLQTNFASIGQILIPHYEPVFRGVSTFSGALSVSGILTGSRVQPAFGSSLPSRMPWMCISYKEYWCLCFQSVLSCLREHTHDW